MTKRKLVGAVHIEVQKNLCTNYWGKPTWKAL
jgi:hypothetical protein